MAADERKIKNKEQTYPDKITMKATALPKEYQESRTSLPLNDDVKRIDEWISNLLTITDRKMLESDQHAKYVTAEIIEFKRAIIDDLEQKASVLIKKVQNVRNENMERLITTKENMQSDKTNLMSLKVNLSNMDSNEGNLSLLSKQISPLILRLKEIKENVMRYRRMVYTKMCNFTKDELYLALLVPDRCFGHIQSDFFRSYSSDTDLEVFQDTFLSDQFNKTTEALAENPPIDATAKGKKNEVETSSSSSFMCAGSAQTDFEALNNTTPISVNKDECTKHNFSDIIDDAQVSGRNHVTLDTVNWGSAKIWKRVGSLKLSTKIARCRAKPQASVKKTKQKEICVTDSRDSFRCRITGMAFLPSKSLFLVDNNNNCVKELCKITDTITSYLLLDESPWDITVLSNEDAAVTIPSTGIIQFISTKSGLRKNRQIKRNGHCYGIDSTPDDIIVSFRYNPVIEVLDHSGRLIHTISCNTTPGNCWENYVTIGNFDGNYVVYFTDTVSNSVTMFSWEGNVLFAFKDRDLLGCCGVDLIDTDDVVVCGKWSNNVQLFTKTGTKVRTLLNSADGIRKPLTACHDSVRKVLYLSCEDSNNIHQFGIEYRKTN